MDYSHIKNNIDNTLSGILFDREKNKKLIAKYENELSLLPKGYLRSKIINNRTYLYHCLKNEADNKIVQRYISNNLSDKEFASAIKFKFFIKKSLSVLYKNIKAADLYIKYYEEFDASEIESQLPSSYNTVDLKLCKDENLKPSVSAWLNEPYRVNPLHPEGLINITPAGVKVRSKDESIIGAALEHYGIPYRYEAELILTDKTYYPDFTCLSCNNEIIYWEHFGMLNNPDYFNRMENKINTYMRNGILPGDKLIITSDRNNGSIDSQKISKTIRLMLLSDE